MIGIIRSNSKISQPAPYTEIASEKIDDLFRITLAVTDSDNSITLILSEEERKDLIKKLNKR